MRARLSALQLAEKVYCGSDFGFVGAPDFSPAIAVGLIPGFSPGALSKDRQYLWGNWRTAPGLKPASFLPQFHRPKGRCSHKI